MPKDDVVFGASDDPIFIVAQSVPEYAIFKKTSKLPSFRQMGLTFTTGSIQWDVFEKALAATPTKSSTRLIWAENVQRSKCANPRDRADKRVITTPLRTCEPIRETTIVVERVTAVEQAFRIIATIVDPSTCGLPVQAENHTSYLEQNRKTVELPFVLALLNSRFFDFIFRHINSNTQVSAGELNSLPCPQTAALAEKQRPLIKLVERIPTAKARDAGADVSALERGLDELVCALYSLTKEEQAIVQGADV